MDRTKQTRIQRSLLSGLALAAIVTGTGCGSEQRGSRPLSAEQFAAKNGVSLNGGTGTGNPTEGGGAIPYDSGVRTETPAASPLPTPDANAKPGTISPAVRQAISHPDGSATTKPATLPADAQATQPNPPTTQSLTSNSPTSLDLGFVVLEVNGKPIFSDKILQILAKPLSVEAKRNNVGTFRQIANAYLHQQVEEFKKRELEVAAAEKSLDADDKQLARQVTIQWRQKQVTAAGGSEQLARRKAAEDGWDFDEKVNEQYRNHLVLLYYQKRIYPLAQVPAADVRAYYAQNREREFSTPGRVKFRLIRVDLDNPKYPSIEAAHAAAEKIRDRARTETFATLAADPSVNDDSILRDRAGWVTADGWIQVNNYRFDAVEKALEALRPGAVSEVIQVAPTESPGEKPAIKFLFVGKLEAFEDLKEKSFEDAEVQDHITEKLRAQQIQAMRASHIRDLEKTAVAIPKAGAMDRLLEIVMERYPEWSKK